MPTSWDRCLFQFFKLGQFIYKFFQWKFARLAGSPRFDFKHAGSKPLLPDHHSRRDADEVGVGKFLAGSSVSVVVENFHPGRLKLFVCLVSQFLRVLRKREQMNLERRHRLGPNQALIVAKYFREHSHKSCDAYAVRAEIDRGFVPLLIVEIKSHLLALLGAESEDVSYLHSFLWVTFFLHFSVYGNLPIFVSYINRIFTGFAESLKLVAEFIRKKTSRSRSDVGNVTQTDLSKNIQVRFSRLVVKSHMLLFVSSKRIHVLHQKLSAAQEAGLGSDFVSQFVLELVHIDGQVVIACDMRSHEIGNQLFVRPAEAHLAAGFQRRLEPDIHLLIAPAAGLFPNLFVLKSRHEKFHRAKRFHFFRNDFFDFVDDSQSQRQERIHAGELFIYKPGTGKEDGVLGDFVRGRFAARLGKQLRLLHAAIIEKIGLY